MELQLKKLDHKTSMDKQGEEKETGFASFEVTNNGVTFAFTLSGDYVMVDNIVKNQLGASQIGHIISIEFKSSKQTRLV